MQTITDQDIQDALDSEPIIDGSDPDFKEIARLVAQELMRRLKDDPESLPGTFVIKLYLDSQKALAAGAVPDQGDQGQVDILASLDALPPEHARELLRGEIVRLVALLDAYQDTLLEMEANQ